jgi:hypothetical protein
MYERKTMIKDYFMALNNVSKLRLLGWMTGVFNATKGDREATIARMGDYVLDGVNRYNNW